MTKHPLVVAVTGASGAIYAKRLLEVLVSAGRSVHLTISSAGKEVIQHELGIDVNLDGFQSDALLAGLKHSTTGSPHGSVFYHQYKDFMSPIASGSSRTAGMIICPCSGGTLSAVVHGASSNLIHRAADVHLKERRKLVLVTRETPLSLVHINNMKLATEAGATILPASPGWYHDVNSVDSLVDFVVARILDQFDIEHSLMKRWGDNQ